MADEKKLKRKDQPGTTETPGESLASIGQWYWVEEDNWRSESEGELDHRDNQGRWLGCVVEIGSNYIKIESTERDNSQYGDRIHFDEFVDRCELEPNPDAVIDGKIGHFQERVASLMSRVKEITAKLSVAPRHELAEAGNETQALARVNSDEDVNEYKEALVKAKEDTLPDLFREIEQANNALASWMSAKVIPLKAQAERMEDVIETIEDRIFSVELYAGLVEQVVKVADGDPASNDAKLHLMQRRCYMDEECLAKYEAGGMDFNGIEAFDEWLAESENRDRLLPFPRCMVAFQVRRHTKEREAKSLWDFIRFVSIEQADKSTFLYIRNGDQIFRMSTEIEFDEKLFPDLDKSVLNSGQKLWARMFAGCVEDNGLITDEEHKILRMEYDNEMAEYKVAYQKWKRLSKAQKRETTQPRRPWDRHRIEDYQPFDESNVHYDDISEAIAKDIKKHNRIALIIQGLLDRSPVLHPHPPYQIWTAEGFDACIKLIYDDSRAIAPGDKPDFEAYRERLNSSFQEGSLAVGQEDVWMHREAEKENDRHDGMRTLQYKRYRPYGNPGPGYIARVVKFGKRSRKCTFRWTRERAWNSRIHRDDEVPVNLTVEAKDLLNVDAYTPGDFRQFFDDPRTRAEYIQWAPLLLAAEDYHAGKLKVGKPSGIEVEYDD